ncbi:MAG TPA: hypothetical protein RMH99_20155 [Sandaracinaceae bacterium LLY-WYZ-13_1]|nr:hypothetical protein [Sandaracinaceae bacterium LLY-WYZ-13_1]
MPKPRHDERGGSLKRSLILATALFLVLCGVGLALFGGHPAEEAEAQAGPSPEARAAAEALERTEAAERALMERDYGQAREHVRHVRRILARVTEDGRPSDDDTTH